MKKIFALFALFAFYTQQCDHHEHDHDHDCDHPAHDDCDHPDHNHGNDYDEDHDHDHHDHHNHNHEDHEHGAKLSYEHLLQLFENYDTNKDQKLSHNEIISAASSQLQDQNMIEQLFQTLNPIITKHDAQGDGLDIEQFLNMAADASQSEL